MFVTKLLVLFVIKWTKKSLFYTPCKFVACKLAVGAKLCTINDNSLPFPNTATQQLTPLPAFDTTPLFYTT